jgi:hypothetical protein
MDLIKLDLELIIYHFFFANKSKLSQLVAFPEPEGSNKTIYQINYHNEKEEILSFWLNKPKWRN